MRTMRYRIEMEDGKGYVISNADTTLEDIVTDKNLNRPPLRITNIPLKGERGVVSNIDDYVTLDKGDDRINKDFRKGYLKALHGELKGWKLIAISIDNWRITLYFACEETQSYEYLYVSHAPRLKFMIEDEQENGIVNRYQVKTLTSHHKGHEHYEAYVTEYESNYRRVLTFGNTIRQRSKKSHEDWKYVYVTEYR